MAFSIINASAYTMILYSLNHIKLAYIIEACECIDSWNSRKFNLSSQWGVNENKNTEIDNQYLQKYENDQSKHEHNRRMPISDHSY